VDIRERKENRMLRKSILAFAAVAALGTAALTPATASATWYGKGYGYGYGYKDYGWRYPYRGSYGPRFFYGGKYFGGRKFGWRRFGKYY
jgi:hypothetical protein